MTKEKLDSVFCFYADYLRKGNTQLKAERADITKFVAEVSPGEETGHLLWMCDEARQFIAQGRIEKAMRWLGFLQGMFYARGLFTIDQLGNHSRPDTPEET